MENGRKRQSTHRCDSSFERPVQDPFGDILGYQQGVTAQTDSLGRVRLAVDHGNEFRSVNSMTACVWALILLGVLADMWIHVPGLLATVSSPTVRCAA